MHFAFNNILFPDCEVIKLKEIEISLQDLYSLFMRKFKWIAVVVALCIVLATLFTIFFITPRYTSSVTMLVTSYGDRANASVQYAEIEASRSLVKSYAKLITSSRILTQVAAELDGEFTVNQLRSMLSVQTINDTQIVVVDIETTSAELSAEVGNALAEVLPGEVAKMEIGGKVDIIDYAYVPTTHSSPNLLLNLVIAAFVGAAGSYACFFVAERLDTIVREEEDLTDNFKNIPILGTIPPLDHIGEAGAKGGADK